MCCRRMRNSENEIGCRLRIAMKRGTKGQGKKAQGLLVRDADRGYTSRGDGEMSLGAGDGVGMFEILNRVQAASDG